MRLAARDKFLGGLCSNLQNTTHIYYHHKDTFTFSHHIQSPFTPIYLSIANKVHGVSLHPVSRG